MARPWHDRLVVLAAAALALAVMEAPSQARGTGGWLREWAIGGPLEGIRLDAPDLPADFVAYPGRFAAGHVWVPVEAPPEGKLDLQALYPQPREGIALLHTFFEVPADGTYHLRLGSDDAIRVDIDGRMVHRNECGRAWAADQDKVAVPLAAGWHRVLVRVVNYGGAWAVSVRVSDAKDQPLDVKHQAAVPPPLERECGLDERVTAGERTEAAKFLAARVAVFQDDLAAALPRLAEMPEGHVTFPEYEGARALGRRFFEAMATFWREAARERWDAAAVRRAQKEVVEAARGFSEVLAQETDKMGRALTQDHRVWETLGGEDLTHRQFAAATLQIAELLDRSRQLAARIENERLLVARFENDIRNWRQRNVALRLLDREGGPVADADVEIVQTGHDFLFGCNLFAYRRWDDAKKNALYERRFRDLFNQATVPLYWSVMEKERGRPDFAPVDAAIRWCRENRLQVKGHPLLWPQAVPRWAAELPADEISNAVQVHVRQVVQRYRDTVDFWDVVHQPGREAKIGTADLDPAEALRWALEAKPRGQLLLNAMEGEDLPEVVRRLRLLDVRLDGIGVPAHQHKGPWPLDVVRKTLDAAAATGLPVHVSEVTILGGPDDEAEQAEAVRHFYTAAFAHPKVVSITWWDLSDRFAWQNAPAGLLRADLSPKPAYKVLDRLLNHLWKTDAEGRTDADGRLAPLRVFFGQYRITARHGGRKVTAEVRVTRDGPAEIEVVLKPAK